MNDVESNVTHKNKWKISVEIRPLSQTWKGIGFISGLLFYNDTFIRYFKNKCCTCHIFL